jgi:hypothetical protein
VARSHFIKNSRKSPGDCGHCGTVIRKGQGYYWWKFRYGGKHIRCANHPPRQSDLTASDKLSRAYAASETVEELVTALRDAVTPVTAALTSNDPNPGPVPGVETLFQAVGDMQGGLEEAASEAEEVASEYNESADNIEQTFSSSPTADECRERAESLESWAGTLQSVSIEADSVWEPFRAFVTAGMEDHSLLKIPHAGEIIPAITRATERDATAEDWQGALDRLAALRRQLLNPQAVALFDEAVDGTADAFEEIANEAESAAGELSL